VADIALEGVTKVYPDGTKAVDGLNLEIADGEFMVLVGPSGCGKTTALRMVAGLEDITSGTLTFGGKVVNQMLPKNRDIAMVFQNYALYPQMTVAQNMGFALKIRGMPKAEITERVAEAAKILRLTEHLNRRPKSLSGGQRQRVAMGRAIVRSPQVFLMDEPLSNLDAQLRVEMRTEIARIQRLLGVATIYVTHDQVEAMTMGDRVAVLRLGILQQVATPQELYDFPVNEFVAGFIGSPPMNLIRAHLVHEHDASTFEIGSQRLALPPEYLKSHDLAAATGSRVIVGIRPEDISGAARQDGGPGLILRAKVERVESLGSEVLAHLSVADSTEALIEEIDQTTGEMVARSKTFISRMGARASVRVGDVLDLHLDAGRLHFFDGETGRTLLREGAR
jgi:multiple sugar transport system ATP-binding protein